MYRAGLFYAHRHIARPKKQTVPTMLLSATSGNMVVKSRHANGLNGIERSRCQLCAAFRSFGCIRRNDRFSPRSVINCNWLIALQVVEMVS